MKENTSFVGLDIAKFHIDAYILPRNKYIRISNNAEGLKSLQDWMGQSQRIERIVLEPTGGYERLALETLSSAGYKVSMVQAFQIRSYAKARGIFAKTDKLDAGILAEYGQKMPTRIHIPLTPVEQKLRTYVDRRSQVVQMISEEKNRLQKSGCEEMYPLIKSSLEFLEKQKMSLETTIIELIKSDARLSKLQKILTSIAGIGSIIAAILITNLPELGLLNQKQIAKLVGVAPLNHDSGTVKGKRVIYGGRQYVRNSLYLAAMQAVTKDAILKSFYNRLRQKGKTGKSALIAVIRKMVLILNAKIRDADIFSLDF